MSEQYQSRDNENTAFSEPDNSFLLDINLPITDHKTFFEQYKITIAAVEKVSDRRAAINKFYISLLSGIFTILAFILGGKSIIEPENWGFISIVMILLGIFGYQLGRIWKANLRSFQKLNEAKFTIINAMEKHLPVKPYSQEWDDFLSKKSFGFDEQNKIEESIPTVFQIGYALLVLAGGVVFVLATFTEILGA